MQSRRYRVCQVMFWLDIGKIILPRMVIGVWSRLLKPGEVFRESLGMGLSARLGSVTPALMQQLPKDFPLVYTADTLTEVSTGKEALRGSPG